MIISVTKVHLCDDSDENWPGLRERNVETCELAAKGSTDSIVLTFRWAKNGKMGKKWQDGPKMTRWAKNDKMGQNWQDGPKMARWAKHGKRQRH